MVVGLARLTLLLGQSRSLKDKRQVVRKIVDRVRARFLVAIAEVADNDLWQKATLGIAAVGNEQGHVREVLDEVIRAIEDLYLAPIVACDVQVDTYTDFHTAPFRGGEQPDPLVEAFLAGGDGDAFGTGEAEDADDSAGTPTTDDDRTFESPDAEGIEDAPWATPPRRRS